MKKNARKNKNKPKSIRKSWLSFGFRNKKPRSFVQKVKRFFIKAVLGFLVLSVALVLLFKYLPVPFTYTMLEQKLASDSYSSIKYDWRPMEDISPQLAIAVIAAEDQKFPTHNGFDFNSIKEAYERNQKGEKMRGGSTISQQTAKNVFLWQSRSWLRKGLETYFTFLIELIWGKERILEVYLNVMETGNLTFGAEAAAQKYFKANASKLTRFQACRIAAILPSPRKWKASNPGPYILQRTDFLVKQVRQLGGEKYLLHLE